MTALISAELLRLRTVRAPRFLFVGLLALVALNAAPVGNAPASSSSEVAASLRGLVQLGGFFAALYAAHYVGGAFKSGSVAMTYLTHPLRPRVAAAQALTFAGVGAVVAAAATIAAVAAVLAVADGNQVVTGLSAADIARIVVGASFGGAILGAAGALAGVVGRHPAIAGGTVVAWSVAETVLTRGGTGGGIGGIGPYLPFQLVGSLTGLTDKVAVLPAIGLLAGYLVALALAVRTWALHRDLT